MKRGDYQRQLAAYRQEQHAVQVDTIRQGFSMVWILVIIVITVAAILIVIAFPSMSEPEARQVVSTSEGVLTKNMPEDMRVCVLMGECYSWGMKAEPWHKAFIPVLLIIGIVWVKAVFRKLRHG